jgi:hypothetical protein
MGPTPLLLANPTIPGKPTNVAKRKSEREIVRDDRREILSSGKKEKG